MATQKQQIDALTRNVEALTALVVKMATTNGEAEAPASPKPRLTGQPTVSKILGVYGSDGVRLQVSYDPNRPFAKGTQHGPCVEIKDIDAPANRWGASMLFWGPSKLRMILALASDPNAPAVLRQAIRAMDQAQQK